MDSRKSWKQYFMEMAEHVSTRSTDPSTKHGCVLVDAEHRIVSTGYNGPPRGFPNEDVPDTRPEKYYYMIHAEDNACLYAQRRAYYAYITGFPCAACFRRLCQMGVKEICIGSRESKCISNEEKMAIFDMADELKVTIGVYDGF